ncbi:hypothetical protein ON010_g10655 [Phytophthora cinnamomi]|nr:hypothetical protein ON010_g10655 [Phytophthora cinnamomi]
MAAYPAPATNAIGLQASAPAQWVLRQRHPHASYSEAVRTALPLHLLINPNQAPLHEQHVYLQQLPITPSFTVQRQNGIRALATAASVTQDSRNMNHCATHPLHLRLDGSIQGPWFLPCIQEQLFVSPSEVQKALNTIGRQHGYKIVYKGTTYNNQRQRQLILYGCDRHGAPRSRHLQSTMRPRPNAGSRKCG